ncbi:MAG TPA: hypothetical protein VLH86_05555 [Patescibacteria group bacterium]|nr:hypothetical protein [Patescibacteria group bacterium]
MLPRTPESVCATAPRCFTIAALGCLAGVTQPPASSELFHPADPAAPDRLDYADLLEVAASTPNMPEPGTCPAGATCYRIVGPVLVAGGMPPRSIA